MPCWELMSTEPRGLVEGRDWREAVQQVRHTLELELAVGGVVLQEDGALELKTTSGQCFRLAMVQEQELAVGDPGPGGRVPGSACSDPSAEADTAPVVVAAAAMETFEFEAVSGPAPRLPLAEAETLPPASISLLHEELGEAQTLRVRGDSQPPAGEAVPCTVEWTDELSGAVGPC